jgi:hypothetical protein
VSPGTARLGDIATLNPATPRGLLGSDEEVAFVPMAAVSETGAMRVQEYRPACEISPGLSYFAHGDVLLAKITPCFENNKIALATIDRRHAFGSTEFHVLRPDARHLDARYLCHFLRQDAIREQGKRRMTGSGGQRRVPRAFVEELTIPLPPLDEQRRIAAILDQADTLRRARRGSLQILSSLEAALFVSRFGEQNQWADQWPLVPLIDLCRPKQWPIVSGRELIPDGPYPVFGANGIIGRFDQYNHKDPTVLITCRGATCGTINVCEPKSWVTGNSMALDDLKHSIIRIDFLEWILRRRGVGDAITGSAQPQITRQSLSVVRIPIPPLDLQERFSAELRHVRAMRPKLETSLQSMENLSASLQRRAFTGELTRSDERLLETA